jgi:hypothetical protein
MGREEVPLYQLADGMSPLPKPRAFLIAELEAGVEDLTVGRFDSKIHTYVKLLWPIRLVSSVKSWLI